MTDRDASPSFDRLIDATKRDCPWCGGFQAYYPYRHPHHNPESFAPDRTKPGAVVFGRWRCLDYYGCENG